MELIIKTSKKNLRKSKPEKKLRDWKSSSFLGIRKINLIKILNKNNFLIFREILLKNIKELTRIKIKEKIN